MSHALRIGIAGLGTVGTGLIQIIQDHGALLKGRAGQSIEISAISARSKNKDRGIDLSSYHWVDDAIEMADNSDIDVVVELIGGSDGPALALTKRALQNKKHVVTANKAMMAHHGYELAQLAEENGVSLNYEASIAGGIPIVKAIREGFAANSIKGVYGILNGTCNYILTEMRETGRPFDDVLKEAQEKGYAEADPSFDVDGVDAAHKLCLLSALAFGRKPDFDTLEITGIRHINTTDIGFASEFGYKIKLLGIAKREENNMYSQRLEPCLVPENCVLGSVEGVFNAVDVEGDYVGSGHLIGRGAGAGPTASAVLSDIIDIARGYSCPTFGCPAGDLTDPSWIDAGELEKRFYIRCDVVDQPGVLADVSKILQNHDISIEAFLQRGRDPGQSVPLVMITHETRQKNITQALGDIEKLNSVLEKPCIIPIEDFQS